MRKALYIISILLLISALGSAQTVEREVTLNPGWNTVGLDVQDVSFSEDIEDKCNFGWYNLRLNEEDGDDISFSEDEKHYVWEQLGGEWSHPDVLDPSKGYSLYLRGDSSCSFTVDGEKAELDTLELREGWNTINIRSFKDVEYIGRDCGNSLQWWNTRLKENNVDAGDISDEDKYYYWINKGNDWRHVLQGYSVSETDGAYVSSIGSCTVNLDSEDGENENSDSDNEQYLEFDSSGMNDDNIEFRFNRETATANDITPEVSLAVNGEIYKTERFEDSQEVQLLDLNMDELRSEFGESVVQVSLRLEGGSEDSHNWDEDFADIGGVNISCGDNKVWDNYNSYNSPHSCVEKTLDQDLAEGWELNVDGATKYRMDEIKSNNLEDKSEIVIKTGEKGYCGELSLELEDLSNVISTEEVDLTLEVLDDSSYVNSRSPYILDILFEVDGDRSTTEFEKGEKQTVSNIDVTDGSSFEIGVVEDNDFACGSTTREISLEASIEETS